MPEMNSFCRMVTRIHRNPNLLMKKRSLTKPQAEVEAAVVLTNGGGVPDSNGASEGAENVRVEPGMRVTDQIPNDEEEEEEGTLVMRAECVLITDEGDDVSQELTSQEDQQGSVESDKTHLLDPEAGEGEGVAVKTETPPEALGESEGKEPPVEPQSLTRPLEGVTVTAVPVYTETPLPIISPANEDAAAADRTEPAAEPSNPSTALTQFQEVPLTGPEDRQNKDSGPGEQAPLLVKVEASNSADQPAGREQHRRCRDTGSESRGEQNPQTEKLPVLLRHVNLLPSSIPSTFLLSSFYAFLLHSYTTFTNFFSFFFSRISHLSRIKGLS
ncbi:hypothetical protein FQA47_010688 [Oryzias melastigma]|uniref:Uncharacterized protein n=1 Tax=Oryzias melastigma TaxID=30732 RepID=A0A834BQC7_ORYME|nr:hypothetical protein FQA47_010688 [Oryzias melastigma]